MQVKRNYLEFPHSARAVMWEAARRTVDRQGWRAIEPYTDVLVGVSCALPATAPTDLQRNTQKQDLTAPAAASGRDPAH